MTSGQSPLVCICIGQVRNAFAYVPGQGPPLTVLRHFPVAEHALCFIGRRCCISTWIIVQCVPGVLRTVRFPRLGRSRYISRMRVKGFHYSGVNSNRNRSTPLSSTRKSRSRFFQWKIRMNVCLHPQAPKREGVLLERLPRSPDLTLANFFLWNSAICKTGSKSLQV